MKKRFQVNGEFFEIPEGEVSAFLADNPQAVEVKNYNIKGSEYNIPIKEVASFEADMGFDDHTQKEEFQKKSQNGNGNGSGQPSEPSEPLAVTTSPSPEDEYSGKRPSSFPLPEPAKPGFKTQLNLETPPQEQQQIAPVKSKTSIDVLKDDYLANKVDIDKSLTSTVGDDPAFGQYVQDDSLFKSLTDHNGDTKLLAKYSKKRNRDLDNEILSRKEQLEQKYPGGIPTPLGLVKKPEYYKELEEFKKEIDEKKGSLMDAVREIAYKKTLNAEFKKSAEPKFVNKTIGREIRRATGDPTLDREERLEMKGLPLSPAENYYNDKVGFIAKASVLKDMDDNGVDIMNNPVAKKLYESVRDGKEKLLNDHKDFTRQQAARLISDEISRDKNWFQLMTGAYTINDKDIKKYAKQLGIPDNIADQVEESDIHTSNIFGEFANELVARPGANIGTFIGRPFRREVLGQDPDAIDAHYEALNKKFTTVLADAPDAQAQFGLPTTVGGDATKENFLEDVRNADQGKFNWNPAVIANSIANGAGQMIQYGIGGTATGGALVGVNKLLKTTSDIQKAKNVGLVTYGFINSYESGYQKGRELVGDAKEKETQRNVIGALYAGIQAFSELIFPDYKVTDKLFGVKNAGSRQLLELLAKAKTEDAAKALTSAVGKKTLTAAIKEGVVKTAGNTLKEIGEEEAALIGDVVLSTVTNKKSLDDRDIGKEFVETAVVTALSAAIPIGLGEMRQTDHTSGIKKSMVHEMGIDPKTVIAHINSEADDGKISKNFANKKISIVNTMADIVKQVPQFSPLNSNKLSEKDKIDYAYNLLHTTFLNDKLAIDKKTDQVQEKITEDKLKELAKERETILQNADGIEKNFNGQPIYERDAGKVVGEPEEITRQIELSTEVPITDYTGKDNNFLANKEEGFFNPQERETYNELMKKPETEEQAAQMVADKKEEHKKFAPLSATQQQEWDALPMAEKLALAKKNLPEFDSRTDTELAKIADTRAKELLGKLHEGKTEEVKQPEVKEEVPEEIPEVPAETYRSEEEAAKIINEKLDKPGDFVKKFKADVKYHDIVTGEIKTGKTYQAKKDLEGRYNKVNELIVNCLT